MSSEQILNVPRAEREPTVEPDSPLNDRMWEVAVAVVIGFIARAYLPHRESYTRKLVTR